MILIQPWPNRRRLLLTRLLLGCAPVLRDLLLEKEERSYLRVSSQ